jgi:hypothetical protein
MGLGWQEFVLVFVIFAILALIWFAPIVVVWRGSQRRTGEVSVPWVIVAMFLGWLGALVWAIFGRRSA